MKHGSLQNSLLDGARPGPAPEVGMPATVIHWSDRQAYYVADIIGKKARSIVLQRAKVTRTDTNGMSECQEYSYEQDPDAPILVATKRKDGNYRLLRSTERVLLGTHQEYRDFSF